MLKYTIEIKNRLLIVFFVFLSILLTTYIYKEILIFLIIKPQNIFNKLSYNYFIFTNVTDVFSIYLKVIYFITIQITFITFIYQFTAFISNALFKYEYYFLISFLKTFIVFWSLSIFLTSYILIPFSWNFFFSFQELIVNKFMELHFEPKINEYFEFCLSIYYISLFYSQLFASLFFLILFFSKNLKNTKNWRKVYYYSFLVFSTLISPPEILSQILTCLILILFYEFLILITIFKKNLFS